MNNIGKYLHLKIICSISCVLVLISSCDFKSNQLTPENEINFNDDVRPILNNKCIGCHGGVRQSGGLSFILRESAIRKIKSGKYAIVPGNSHESEMIARIKSTDPDFRMPMDKEALTKNEIRTLQKWIDQGAKWQNHWSFEKPQQKELPKVEVSEWVNNPIDLFVLDRLHQENLKPSKVADKLSLIRRVSLDIIGLPPSAEEIEYFIDDLSEDAYEKLVDRLLESKHYGERWAAMWMDLARYADSKGYEKDGYREMWKYRDWLIDAFNQNMSFDEFTIQQLAGDLLPDPTSSNVIATAFHRNTMNNDEGGTIDEEYRMAAVIDRVNTTWEIWQGTTFSCVQCHSHPYDPFEQKEYYEFLSFFNNTEDADLPSEIPIMEVFTKQQEKKLAILNVDIKRYEGNPSEKRNLRLVLDQKDSIESGKLPIMKELPKGKNRETHVFIKGNRLDLGELVGSDVPDLLPELPEGSPPNRLGMAQWLVAKENPLTARVTVNRFWAQLFGKGIVETEEDFGSKGFKPSHPELLDWLALEFQNELNWNIKALLKLIVTSATYKQSSVVTSELQEKDPSNKLLARGARVRLTAEQIRDQALFVSGLLSEKMYGKSVMPYQPDDVWQTVYSGTKWVLAEGEDSHRRALYTYWRRTSPYPSMISFDSPSREVCVIRRFPTNTPLQALVTLNDPVYIEAANALSSIMDKKGINTSEKIEIGYSLALGRLPVKEQLDVLLRLYRDADEYLRSEKESINTDSSNMKSDTLKISGKDRMKDIALETPLSYVANAILNLNEFTTKQ